MIRKGILKTRNEIKKGSFGGTLVFGGAGSLMRTSLCQIA
jgi:hypothetical protein